MDHYFLLKLWELCLDLQLPESWKISPEIMIHRFIYLEVYLSYQVLRRGHLRSLILYLSIIPSASATCKTTICSSTQIRLSLNQSLMDANTVCSSRPRSESNHWTLPTRENRVLISSHIIIDADQVQFQFFCSTTPCTTSVPLVSIIICQPCKITWHKYTINKICMLQFYFALHTRMFPEIQWRLPWWYDNLHFNIWPPSGHRL